MAIPVAPTITQIATTSPVTAGTPVADLLAAEAETYATTSAEFAVTGAQLTAVADTVAGSYDVAVTATNVEGTSPEGTATLAFADAVVPPPDWSYLGDDPNPQIPPFPPTHNPENVPDDAWTAFMTRAVHLVQPLARDGLDFNVARPTKYAAHALTYWNEAELGPAPTAAIEAVARQLYADHTR